MDDNAKDRQQDLGASACAISNGQNPRPHFHAYYGSTPVPRPTNSAAKIVNHAIVMEQVLDAK